MIVRLTTGRENAVRLAVMEDPDVLAAITHDRHENGARVDVYAPYAAWLAAREALMDRAFTNRGYRAKGVPSTVQAAIRDVSQAIGFIDRHPALRGSGTLGHHPLVLHVWRLPQADSLGRVFTPYPIPGGEFVALKPTWHSGAGRARTTTWGPDGISPGHDRLAEEMVHQSIWRERLAQLRNVDVHTPGTDQL